MSELREQVRERYAEAALSVTSALPLADSSCCGAAGSECCGATEEGFGAALYDTLERSELPDDAVLASLGCGNPTAVAELRDGETVLDLGSGGGIDALLSAKRAGPSGKVYGLDMTEEMLALALKNKEEAGATNVEFLKGFIEDIPLPAATIDVVISNCVINLSADKPKVFREIARVLKPGGRMGVTDVIAADELSTEQRAERGSFVGCIAGALSFSEYESELRRAGLVDVSVQVSHETAPQMFSAIVKARKPGR